MPQLSFWKMPLSGVKKALETSDNGLSAGQIMLRQKQYGPNVPHTIKRRSSFSIFISQFNSPLIIILIGVSFFSYFVGETLEASIIVAMLLINAFIGFLQENKAEKSLERLFALVKFRAKVLRQGEIQTINRSELVPGDIVILNAGDIVPADMRILETRNLTVNEAALTGESVHVEKNANGDGAPDEIPQNIDNGLFMGTSIATGYAKGVVVYIGSETILGKSVAPGSTQVEKTNFEKNLVNFTQLLLRFVIVLTVVITVVNTLLGRGIVMSLLLAITLALGITPEVMPIIVTIAISTAAYNLSKKQVVVRRLTALEDMGNLDILCSDKTGTITTGELHMHTFTTIEGNNDPQLLIMGLYCNSANPQTKHQMMDNPLDTALYAHTDKKLQADAGKVFYHDFHDFDFGTKTMSVLISDHLGKDNTPGGMQITKGATESILALCTQVSTSNGIKTLTEADRKKLKTEVASYEARGYRVISLAYINTDAKEKKIKNLKLIYKGFFVFEDPPREAVRHDIIKLQELHISLKIITGDSPVITEEICNKVGLKILGGKILTGAELESMNAEALKEAVTEHNVFARVTPDQKKTIIQTLQSLGHVVGYMGDGINDVGALTTADVGISVDTAVAVAKDASDVIMLRKDLSAIIDGVKEGRRTFGNTIKFITNTMSSSFGNVMTIAISSFFLKFIPLLPSQLLLNDTVSDLQHLATSTDNVDVEMLHRPRNWDSQYLFRFMIIFGLISTLFDFILMGILLTIGDSPEMFRTLWFIESSVSEMIATFAVRTIRPFWKNAPSLMLLVVSVFAIFLSIFIPFIPIGQELFSFVPVHLHDLLLIFGLVGIYFSILEIVKLFFYRFVYNPYKLHKTDEVTH